VSPKGAIVLIIIAVVWCSLVLLVCAEASCDAEHDDWTRAYEILRQRMDDYRRVKEESITPRIEEEFEKNEQNVSAARIVQEVLNNRARSMEEARTKCMESAERERSAFDEWRRCARVGATRRGNPDPRGPDAMVRQRNELLAYLQDLLSDEAYAQYKNYRDPSPASYTSYGSDQGQYPGQEPWRVQQQMGAYPYQGYFR